MSRPRLKTRKTEDPGQDPHWQYIMLPTSWQHLRPFPHKRDPLRQVSASHDKSPRRTSSPLTPTETWATTRSASLGRECLHRDAWGNNSPLHAKTPAGGPCKQLAPTRALIRVCPATQPSHRHHLQLCHTQASLEALKHPLRQAQT
jgi:hypothetical protein